MGSLKNELKEIVDKTIFSFHGDIAGSNFLIRYGIKEFLIRGNKLLEICKSNDELSLEKLLSLREKSGHISTPHLIGEIQVFDDTHNRIGGFNIGKSFNEGLLFERRFYDNLRLIDGGMPKLLANIVDIVKAGEISRSIEILDSLIVSNPLHFANDWIDNAYRFKIGRLLYSFVLGMNEDSMWSGLIPNGGVVCLNGTTGSGFGYYDQTSLGNYLIASSELCIEGLKCYFELVKS